MKSSTITRRNILRSKGDASAALTLITRHHVLAGIAPHFAAVQPLVGMHRHT